MGWPGNKDRGGLKATENQEIRRAVERDAVLRAAFPLLA
jgi:hypothetical protein